MEQTTIFKYLLSLVEEYCPKKYLIFNNFIYKTNCEEVSSEESLLENLIETLGKEFYDKERQSYIFTLYMVEYIISKDKWKNIPLIERFQMEVTILRKMDGQIFSTKF